MYRNIKEGNQEADRTFWDILSCLWPDWRRSLYIVQPETVINWQQRVGLKNPRHFKSSGGIIF